MMRGATVIGYYRRKSARNLDLNSENCEQGELSSRAAPNSLQRHSTTDVEVVDDDIVESSARAFAEAKSKSRRNAGRTVVELEEQTTSSANNHNKRRRVSQSHMIINCDLYVNVEGNNNSKREKSVESSSPPRKEPAFSCPICMADLVEETSTKCGHIFCKTCIKTAVRAQGKCPACRTKVNMKELVRVYLPAME